MKIVPYVLAGVVALLVISLAGGLYLPEAHVASRTVTIRAPVEKIWDVVTDVEGQTRWRRGLEGVEILERTDAGVVWKETPETGSPIVFREKEKVPYSRYVIEVVPGGPFSGHWVGSFSEAGEGTRLVLTEVAEIHNPFIRFLAYFFFDLEKTIADYQSDLKSYVEERP